MASTEHHTSPEEHASFLAHRELEQAADNANTTENGPSRPPQQTISLRYRKRNIYLLIFYALLLVIPWVLTCVLAGPPARKGGSGQPYFPQSGLSAHGIYSMLSWVAAVRTLNSIAGVITIPVISALLAQAAVVYTQKRKINQTLNLRQTFVLADRRWSDPTVIVEAFRSTGSGISSRFLWLGMALVLLSAAQHPIQQLLVSWESVPVMTCLDDPSGSCGWTAPVVVGYDPEPADLATIRQNRVVQEVMSSLAIFNELDFETHMWPDPSYLSDERNRSGDPPFRQTLRYWTDKRSDPLFTPTDKSANFFVTALQNGTATGVLREHAIRLNSSAVCEKIPPAEFPSTCLRKRPFKTSFSHPLLDIRVCVPGEYGVFPWTLSRHRQDINEHLFLDVVDRRNVGLSLSIANFTLHCTASTTRGYFELGNYMNSQVYGPLIDRWPDAETMVENFNDELSLAAGNGGGPPTEQDETDGYHYYNLNFWTREPADPYGTYMLNMPGPLMTSAIALFGNQSFFEVAANSTNKTFPPAIQQICQQGRIPFSNLAIAIFGDFQGDCYAIAADNNRLSWGSPDPQEWLAAFLGNWFYSFNNTNDAELALLASMYVSNRAMLTQTVTGSFAFSARQIKFGGGMLVPLPQKTLAGTVVVTILIFLQLLGLLALTYYIYQLPTWTHALDAVAVARMSIGLNDPVMRELAHGGEIDQAKLKKIDGLVGLDNDMANVVLGGPEVITRRHAMKPKKKADGE
ncbi:hypothetical protein N7447_004104 [Penicillium robsamsonii]|uniref:uncharacterized protein n=1 Tax=Penicillium robsamsonii TaxID=1792511 RepID=UPI002547E4E9|nr:uncharacterized protein N7447_004104 [Penicillium robsamsonii]KAJ5827341.1 hypothetical protein N7447_004104 [Penicillium robsamsonii]